jgi:hypothetical protein
MWAPPTGHLPGGSHDAARWRLTCLASHSLPLALLAAGTATGSSAGLLRQDTGAGPERRASDRDDNQDDDHDGGEQNRT